MNKYNLKDFYNPTLYSIITISISYYLLNKIPEDKIDNLSQNIFEISINFGLTFIAFSVTAFALIQLLESKKWFSYLKETETFKIFVNNFRLAVIINIGIFFVAILGKIIIIFLSNSFRILFSSLIIGMISFSIFWIWSCISALFPLYRD